MFSSAATRKESTSAVSSWLRRNWVERAEVSEDALPAGVPSVSGEDPAPGSGSGAQLPRARQTRLTTGHAANGARRSGRMLAGFRLNGVSLASGLGRRLPERGTACESCRDRGARGRLRARAFAKMAGLCHRTSWTRPGIHPRDEPPCCSARDTKAIPGPATPTMGDPPCPDDTGCSSPSLPSSLSTI